MTERTKSAEGAVYCSTPGCGVLVGNGMYGAKQPRPCSRCNADFKATPYGMRAGKWRAQRRKENAS